jgi:alpha-L-rhamnosidase
VRVAVEDQHEQWSEWSEPVWFETGYLYHEWSGSWVAGPAEEPRSIDDEATPGEAHPAPYLRREFELSEDRIEGITVRLSVVCRGLAEIFINGRRVGADVLSPGWTDYNLRCQYITHDATDFLVPGTNVIGAILGDGWYSGRIARVQDGIRRFGSTPQLLLELRSVADPGGVSELLIATDAEWQWATGPILLSDIYDGEVYDARKELSGWNETGTPDGDWKPVRVVGPAEASWTGSVSEKPPKLDAKLVPPVRRIREITPVAVSEPESGRHVYDLGQNITGWARVAVAGATGKTVTARFAEMLQEDGTLYTENLRSALATDSYTFASEDAITWEPKFTFHGFRYVELSGIDIDPDPSQVTGIVLHNDLVETGSFSCSSELVNQLQSNIQWGQRGNYLEAPTDCPQRDERLGWTGDAQVFIPTGAFNMNVAPFFRKWQRDLADAQGPNGTIPSIAPAIRYMVPEDENDGGPAWSDAVIICPWTIYQRYGDTAILEEHYDSMRRFVESMQQRSRGLIRSDEFVTAWGGYGDWVSMDAPEGSPVGATPKDLIGTAYFAHSTHLLQRIATLLGKQEDAVTLRDLHARIVRAFQSEFLTSGGRLVGDTQTGYAVALAFDMLPEEYRQGAVDRLVRLLERRNYRLNTGFVGTPLLCPTLSRFGRTDVAYKLLLQEEFPSWLYTVHQGATTMWERWNSYTHEHGFGPVSMNSFNHYAYGSIGEWMYRTVAGLEVRFDALAEGEAVLRIAPHPGYGLQSASATLETPFGTAASSWQLTGRRVTLSITIPPNARAHVEVPAGTAEVEIDTDEGEEELESLVIHEQTADGVFHFRVAAGAYQFAWDSPSDSLV